MTLTAPCLLRSSRVPMMQHLCRRSTLVAILIGPLVLAGCARSGGSHDSADAALESTIRQIVHGTARVRDPRPGRHESLEAYPHFLRAARVCSRVDRESVTNPAHGGAASRHSRRGS